jgi:two-component system, NtrC family, sensor histidine kinase KinB
VVSHELKTPLTSIRMGLHLVVEERVGPLNEKQAELLTIARDDADRLHRIIEGLLEMGRIRSGRAMMDIRPIAAEAVMADAVDALEPAFRDKGVKIESDASPDVPSVLADRVRIGLVISNLLGNALKFTSPGGHVRITARRGEGEDGGKVAFAVEDDGPGIPPESLPHVFERFFQVPGRAEGGAGLGLAIAKEVVEAHGGKIWAESRVGAGSRFGFTVPAEPKEGGDP